jgi:hypothetical protein
MKKISNPEIFLFVVPTAVFLFLFIFGGVALAAESEDEKFVLIPAPVPVTGGEMVRLPYPPGPDFSWLRGVDSRLKKLADSKPAPNSNEPRRLVAGASYTLGRMPWYMQVLLIISLLIFSLISYFCYRYFRTKKLIDSYK